MLKDVVKSLASVNDAGERAVKFASDFNGLLTRNPAQHGAMLQGVEEVRRRRPVPQKKQ